MIKSCSPLLYSLNLSLLIGAGTVQAQASLDEQLDTPDWLNVSMRNQTRFEALDEELPEGDRYDQVLAVRTTLRADMDFQPLDITLELMDNRVTLEKDDTPLGGAMVNPLDILQAYITLGDENLNVKLGRFTEDVGSRRFMARNRYRNTINAFDGINARWQLDGDSSLQAFYSFPVERRYRGEAHENRMKTDRSHSHQRFWGVVYERGNLPLGNAGELYLLTVNEGDDDDLQTRNREIYSLGGRIYRQPELNSFDHELEVMFQEGHSRRTESVADTRTLDHSARFLHAEIGYTFNALWRPRLQVHYDYVSGDDDPMDNENNALDSLFGVPRPDFGPTGIYRVLVRNNLSSPAVRLQLKPSSVLGFDVELRDARLASTADANPSTGLTSPAPGGDHHLGTQLETRLRWEAVPARLRIEFGTAYFDAGPALEAMGIGDKIYAYLQSNYRF